MILTAKNLRLEAKKVLKNRYWWVTLAAFLSILCTLIIAWICKEVTDCRPNCFFCCGFFYGLLIAFSILISFALLLLNSTVGLGFVKFVTKLYECEEKPSLDTLFDYFKQYKWKAFWLDILIDLKILAWGLLLIVPGIIAGIRYSQAKFILAENPELSAIEAISRSKEMMKNQKWKYFCFRLSYIGWFVLASIVPGGQTMLLPYSLSGCAAFYLDRTGRLSKEENTENAGQSNC